VSAYSGAVSVLGGGAALLEGSCAPCGRGTVTFVRTRDGGRTYRRTTLVATTPGPMAFATRSSGLAILTPSPRGVPTIYRTRDGGRSWHAVLSSRRLR
jgi:photosystem II stability/assembly factor-like uncharacterized protein